MLRLLRSLLPMPLALLAACAREGGARIQFFDAAANAGIDVKVVCGDERRWYIPESNGSGAAWLDFDGDGRMDLFVANGATMRYVEDGKRLEIVPGPGCRLYRNEGGLRFADATKTAGAECHDWVNGVAAADVDNDGDPDLYLANLGPDRFLRNEGGRFSDATREAELGNEKWGASAAFGDADLDGDLDLYVANYCEFDAGHPPAGGKRNVIQGVEVAWGPEKENPGINVGAPDRFYVNDGTGRFREAAREAGLELAKPLCSYAAIFADLDRDGLPEILVANDGQPSNLFHNLGKLRFREEGEARGFAFGADGKATAAMGLSAADFDGDGDLDVFKTNFDFEPNSLHVNDGKGSFTDRAGELGLAAPSVEKLGWACGFFDADCDGDLDLLVANGHVYPQAEKIGMHAWLEPTQLYECVREASGRLAYRDATAEAGPGLRPLRSARGIAFGDPDDDGDVDAVVIDLDGPPRLLENRSARGGRWLEVALAGKASNRDGIGAFVTVVAGSRRFAREARPQDGLYSSNDPRLHFGLGPVERIDRLEVAWPSGAKQTIESPPLDRLLRIAEP